MEQQQPDVIIGNPQTQQISAKEFAAKYKSKREVYNFLSVDVGVYLPAYGLYLRFHFLDRLCFFQNKSRSIS